MINFCKLVCGAAVALFGVIVVADLMKPLKRKRSENMENYICINGQKVELAQNMIDKVRSMLDAGAKRKVLADLEPGETFKVGEHEFVVLEHRDGETAVIHKGLLHESMVFGKNNNFAESYVLDACTKFADQLKGLIGEENLVEHTVDLTSDDGLDDYDTVDCCVSLLTANQYRRWVRILDQHKFERWWWLATPYSTNAHENDRWAKCVAPSGGIDGDSCKFGVYGVRPFCILKSSIFVS